jgi:lipopolysaccharide transport system permease protein
MTQALEAWPEAPAPGGPPPSGQAEARRRPRGETVTSTARSSVRFREYFQYRELFTNLTLRELRSKYKRSVIGWGWSMINPLANMLVYTIVFSDLFKISAPVGVPSHLDSYALMYLSAMLPFMMWQSSIIESMGALLGNQNLIQKTWFPRELIPGATVASKLVSHIIEMSLLLVVIVAVGNYRALELLPGVIALMAVITVFALGMSLLFSIANVFWRDIQHFSNILFFIWMFLTPVAYPYYIVGGGVSGPPSHGAAASLVKARIVHLFGHAFSLGSLFKVNPMTDAVLTMQSFIYSGSLPGVTHTVVFAGTSPPPTGYTCSATPAGMSCLIPSNVSWFDVGYFVVWAFALLVIGLWVFRKYEARLPEEL